MTIIQMDKMSAPSQERVRRLYEKNIELDNRWRKSAQARLPSDPNIWQHMRENYEAIILEDHAFSEQHNIEHALWQLHYKKIEELRALYNAAQASTNSNTSHSTKGPPRPDRITKIRVQFKTFLSEASGFYHDLIMKIRSKYGLPLGYFAEESDSRLFLEKDGKKHAEMKKGLISCHRCLIYLGDLARYKGSYGDSGSRAREYAAASSYYLQAASLWPSIGNPHHQLAILASYSGDDMVTIYRYFRSLAVDNPCSTARDNLIVAFEKNRQNFSQLPGDVKLSTAVSPGKGREQAKLELKDADKEASANKGLSSNTLDARRYFSTCFVRLSGILFTRTSLETFSEVLSLVSAALCELLSFAPEEEMNFGADFLENGLFFVRLVAILIFSAHNAKRESEGQTYAEIVQRAVVVKNAYTAAFEIMGHILKRCEQLHDPSSSYLLPCILVFMEWLACCPDVVTDSDVDKKQETIRSSFWNYCISLLNKLLADRTLSMEDNEDDTCFNNMTKYEEGETGNQLALMEDFELRGFLPLIPAQTILDFSKKPSLGSEIKKEKLFRLKRIFAASKALMGAVKFNQEKIWYNSKVRKFVIGGEISDDTILPSRTMSHEADELFLENGADNAANMGIQLPNNRPHVDGEEEDEEIVFKPSVSEKQTDVTSLSWASFGVVEPEISTSAIYKPFEVVEPGKGTSEINQPFYGASASGSFDNPLWGTSGAFLQSPVSIGNFVHQDSHSMKPHASFFSTEQENSLVRSFRDMTVTENGHVMKPAMQESIESHPAVYGVSGRKSPMNTGAVFYSQAKPAEIVNPFPRINGTASSEFTSENLSVNPSSDSPRASRKNPVSRPARHLGPPPGFSNVPKKVNEPIPDPGLNGQHLLLDDYSWLDGYQVPPNETLGLNNTIRAFHANSLQINGSAGIGSVNNPFPGMHGPIGKQMGRQDYDNLDLMKLLEEKQLQESQQRVNGNMQFAQPPQNQGSVWSGRYFV